MPPKKIFPFQQIIRNYICGKIRVGFGRNRSKIQKTKDNFLKFKTSNFPYFGQSIFFLKFQLILKNGMKISTKPSLEGEGVKSHTGWRILRDMLRWNSFKYERHKEKNKMAAYYPLLLFPLLVFLWTYNPSFLLFLMREARTWLPTVIYELLWNGHDIAYASLIFSRFILDEKEKGHAGY